MTILLYKRIYWNKSASTTNHQQSLHRQNSTKPRVKINQNEIDIFTGFTINMTFSEDDGITIKVCHWSTFSPVSHKYFTSPDCCWMRNCSWSLVHVRFFISIQRCGCPRPYHLQLHTQIREFILDGNQHPDAGGLGDRANYKQLKQFIMTQINKRDEIGDCR